MDETYDYIVLGTGLTECILSGILSNSGKKVLHMDKNNYYGGESASISPLSALFSKFERSMEQPDKYGRDRDWSVDLVPKFLMADGQLVKLLIYTGVTRYLEFKNIEGSYVLKDKTLHKVPCDETEALASSLMGMFEKRRFRKFLIFCIEFNEADAATYSSAISDLETDKVQKIYDHFELDAATQDFIGHAICLYTEATYKETVTARDAIKRVQLYSNSLAMFKKSPYVYPMYGLGELPQGFARLSAVFGGTYMLEKPAEEIVMEGGRAIGVRSEGETAKCSAVICDPTYAPDKVRKNGSVIRAICILNHPIAATHDSLSCQIIIPQSQVNRKNDIYISCVSHSHAVAASSFFIALVATQVETNDPHSELQPGIDLLGEIDQIFYQQSDLFEPIDDGTKSGLFISKSYDATTHFESTCQDVLNLYKRITGEDFDFAKIKVHEIDDAGKE